MNTSSPSRSRFPDLPKPDSAAGVGEWARKIKALQQQVDADEEASAEHKRLQEEIAASRIARKRRSSRGVGYANSLDFASSRESLPGASDNRSSTPSSDLKSIADRQQGQADALQKLTGGTSTQPPEAASSIASARAWMSSTSTRTTASNSAAEPISLAAFMGGRATGPMLNRHAPQQDAHDPTEFEQRVRPSAPHPIFGRGGVAMPGMASSNRFPQRNEQSSSPAVVSPKWRNEQASRTNAISPSMPDEPSIAPQRTGGRDRTMSTPDTSALAMARERSASPRKSVTIEEPSISPQKTGGRDRTMSTPSTHDRPASPQKGTRNLSGHASASPFANVSPTKERPISPGYRDGFSDTSTGSYSPKVQSESSAENSPAAGFSRAKTPSQAPSVSRSPPSTSHKPSVATPSLAKVIRPDPKPSPQGPQISVSQTASPAFLKPPVQKDPTPSLSRLQGRGFVQNMVKASRHLETPPSSTQTTPEKHVTGARKASVLDRWQPQQSTSSAPTSPPPVSVSPKPMRKSWTVDVPSSKPAVTEPPVSTKSLRSIPAKSKSDSEPVARSQPPLDPQGTGLGSATTLVVFKPVDEEELGFGDVNELGVRRSPASSQHKLPVATGKPLNHPTKERARKPKKSREPSGDKNGASPVAAEAFVPEALPPSASPSKDIRITPPKSEFPPRDEPPRPSLISRSPSGSGAGKPGKVTDRWAEQAIIGVRPVLSRTHSSESEVPKAPNMVGRRALPGLAPVSNPNLTPSNVSPGRTSPSSRPFPVTRTDSFENAPSSPSTSPAASKYPFEPTRPVTPSRHSRIPSTGNRATVMDVAQAFSQPESQSPVKEASPEPEEEEEEEGVEELPPISPVKPSPSLRPPVVPPAHAEKRRSSYHEKYSAIVLPPLQEEATPTPSPAGTLARGTSPVVKAPVSSLQGILQDVFEHKTARTASETSGVFFDHDDQPLPKINVDVLLEQKPSAIPSLDANVTTISVEVMSILGSTSTALSRDIEVFYDAEVLAIVHRSKSKTSGLVSTTVWGWFGKNSQSDEREQNKLEELAKRYRTSLIVVHQYAEPLNLISVLGNKLAVRQGMRAHWSAENTAMHVVRSSRGAVFIDELDLDVRSLCSAFSYCVTVLDTIYVWHGRGSVDAERKAALDYARSLGGNTVELSEGESEGDEMFWMILGEDAFANANYWRWRPSSGPIDPRVWTVSNRKVVPQEFLNVKEASTTVQLVDCIWELFIIVGRDARSQRENIRLALDVATGLASRVALRRPHNPPIHVVVLPSQIPLDLKLHFRELDELSMNMKDVPDHMNILSLEEAHDHLRRQSWERFSLRDSQMLPLGIHPEQL